MAGAEQVTVLQASLDPGSFVAEAKQMEMALDGVGKAAVAAGTAIDNSKTKVLESSRVYDRLKASIDPVYKAELDLARAKDVATRATDRGKASQEDANKTIALYQQRLDAATAAASSHGRAVNGANDNVTGGFRNMGTVVQQAGFQLSDFFVQVQGGTNVLTAFSQQGSQMLGLFGAFGAIASVGLVIGSVAAQLIFGKSALEQFNDVMKAAQTAYEATADRAERYREGLQREANDIRALATYYNQLSEAQRGVERIRQSTIQSQLLNQQNVLRNDILGAGAIGGALQGSQGRAAGASFEDSAMGNAIGGAASVPAALRPAVEAMRQFETQGNITVESVSRLIIALNAVRPPAGEMARQLDGTVKILVDLLPQVQSYEQAQNRASASALALAGNTAAAAQAIGGLGTAVRVALTPLEELNLKLSESTRALAAFRAGGEGALREAQRQIRVETTTRAAVEAETRRLQSPEAGGLSLPDAQARARESAPQFRDLANQQTQADADLDRAQLTQKAREDREAAERVARAGLAGRAAAQAREQARREADDHNLAGAEREAFVADRVRTAQVNDTSSRKDNAHVADVQAEALRRVTEAAEQGRGAFLQATAAMQAEKDVAGGTRGSIEQLTAAYLARNAAQEAQRGAAKVLDLREQVGDMERLVAAEQAGPRAAHQEQIADRIRKATENLRAYSEVVQDPALKAALDLQVERIGTLTRQTDALAESARNQREISSQGRTLERSQYENTLIGMNPDARAAASAAFAERQRIVGEGGDPDSAEAARRVQNARDIALSDETLKRSKEIESSAREVGHAFATAFEDAAFKGKKLNDVVKDLNASLMRVLQRALIEKPMEQMLASLVGNGGNTGSGSGNTSTGGGGGGGIIGSLLGGVRWFGGSGAADGAKSLGSGSVDSGGWLGSLSASSGGAKQAIQTDGWGNNFTAGDFSIGSNIPLAHTGGIIGEPGLDTRTVPMSVFREAPRYHSGGMVGQRHFTDADEVPAILRKREMVLNERQQRAVAGAMGRRAVNVNMPVTIRATDAPSFRKSGAQTLGDIARGVQRVSKRNF